MGKSRRARANKARERADPVGKPGATPKSRVPTDPELAALREKRVLPVLRDLQSAELKSRSAAATAVANVIQDPRCRKLLLRERVVHLVLTETLTDASLESRAAGWEILRLLVLEEEADFCVHLYRQDVVSAIEFAAEKVLDLISGAQAADFKKAVKAEHTFVWSIADSLSVIILTLAGGQDEILEAISGNGKIMRFVFHLATTTLAPHEIVNGALSCLMTLSEDNHAVVENILKDSETFVFKNLAGYKAGAAARSVLSCGVLHNIFSVMGWDDANPGPDMSSDVTLVLPLINAIETTSLDPVDAHDGKSAMNTAEILEMALEVLASIGSSIQESMEMEKESESPKTKAKRSKNKTKEGKGSVDGDGDVAMDANGHGNTHGEEDAMDVDDQESDQDRDEMDDGAEDEDEDDELLLDMEADMEMVAGGNGNIQDDISGLDDLPALKLLVQKAVPQIIKLYSDTTAPGSKDRASAAMIRNRTIATLNNIAWIISCFEFTAGQNAAVLAAWKPTANTIWIEVVAQELSCGTVIPDVSLATVVASLAWAIARTLRADTSLVNDEPAQLMALYRTSLNTATTNSDTNQKKPQPSPPAAQTADPEDPFQNLGVKCIGALGQLALDPAPIDRNREIGRFLLMDVLHSISPDPSPASQPHTPVVVQAAHAVEALDQLFDIYGNETAACDRAVFWQGGEDGLLPYFEEAAPKLRALVKKVDKRVFAELRVRADEALMNLNRFVAYKKKHRPKVV